MTSVTDAMNDAAQFGYSYGDLSQITDPLGKVTRLFTDNAGRTISMTDALGNLTQLTYDNLDRITQLTDANGGLTKFSYDPDGDLTSLIDAKNNTTSYAPYDSRDRVTTRTDALGKTDSYSYDANSNLTQYTDRNGAVTAYTYDALNRKTFAGFGKTVKGHTTSYSAGTINYTWDGADRLTQAVDSIAGTIGRAYDGLNRLSSETTPQGTVGYTYDSAGRRLTMTVPGQSTVNYTWDNANRLTGITQGSSAVGFTYDNANRRTCLTLPNNVLVSYGYDTDSRVTSIGYGTGGSCSSPPTNLGALNYSYDAGGRRTASGGSLAAVTLPSAVSSSTTAYNVDNEQTKFGSASSMTYDADGELKSDGTNTYTWDARRHLTAISGGATASFVYDAFGRRMKKTVSGTVTQFAYDRLNPVQELNGAAPPAATANLLTGLNIDEYFTRTASSTTSTLLADALGSTIGLVTVNNGPIATSYTYQPFGVTTTGGAGNTNSYQFTGRENDGTGLYFYRARYYSPMYQRFIAQDPIGFAGDDANLYAYVYNTVPSLVDPYGLWGIGLTLGGGGTIGTGGGAAGTSALGIGIFVDGWHLSVGTFATAGGFSTLPHTQFGTGTAHGIAGDYGVNFFVTTANCVQQLKGPFITGAVDAGLGPIQIGSQISVGVDSSGQPVVVGSVSPPGLGEIVGLSAADLITQTVVLGSWNIF